METQCTCGIRTKIRTEEEKKALLNRLSRIEGQIRGVRSMVERDAYCPDVLTQAAAVSAAMDSFARTMLCEHIRTCVAEQVRQGHDEALDELMDVIRKYMR